MGRGRSAVRVAVWVGEKCWHRLLRGCAWDVLRGPKRQAAVAREERTSTGRVTKVAQVQWDGGTDAVRGAQRVDAGGVAAHLSQHHLGRCWQQDDMAPTLCRFKAGTDVCAMTHKLPAPGKGEGGACMKQCASMDRCMLPVRACRHMQSPTGW